MSSANLLAIETATTVCGVAYFESGELAGLEETEVDREHAEKLPQFYQKLAATSRFSPKDLDGIAVSIGPGSFTGLRIGLSFAKGLAFSAHIPIVPVPTLTAIVLGSGAKGKVACLLHSHKDLVYYQELNISEHDIAPKGPPGSSRWKNIVVRFDEFGTICQYGCDDLLKNEQIEQTVLCTKPSARSVGEYALKEFEQLVRYDFHQLEPDYIAHFKMGRPPKPV